MGSHGAGESHDTGEGVQTLLHQSRRDMRFNLDREKAAMRHEEAGEGQKAGLGRMESDCLKESVYLPGLPLPLLPIVLFWLLSLRKSGNPSNSPHSHCMTILLL